MTGWADVYDVRHTSHGDIEVIEVPEDFDVYTAPSVREAAIRARSTATAYVFDFTGTRYMDSTGLAVMVGALKWAREQHHRSVAIAAIGEPQLRILRITGLTKLFEIRETAAEALAALAVTP